ncbi:MAG: hydantoinase/oxoprolinase family protein [Acidimicrobiia bacterium]
MSDRLAVDIGGTFTDVVLRDSTGRLRIGKRLTTHGDEAVAVLAGADDCSDGSLENVDVLTHGTTLIINALLERRGSKVALVTTEGFRDLLELSRSNRPQSFNLFYRRQPELVPRYLRFETFERTTAQGVQESPPSEADLQQIAERCKENEIEAVAIAFINSYTNPANERLAAEHLSSQLPNAFITYSSDVSQEWREFERTSTAVANAYVGPVASEYMSRLDDSLRLERQFAGEFRMLDSNGGSLRLETARRFPARLVESGPVAGVAGARILARDLGLGNVVTFDMGGTTAKSAMVENDSFSSEETYWVGGYDVGFPLQVPTVDILEVGSGGGSIAWVDEGGSLRVGPVSAGSNPGPACYGRGGTSPTVTDANMYCGRLYTESFGSEVTLSAELAAGPIEALANELDLEPRRLARGILDIANVEMAAMVRKQTLERGRNPADFALVAIGGAGPMHAVDVARQVGIQRVLIPVHPGHFSAMGMLEIGMKFDRRGVWRTPLKDADFGELASLVSKAVEELSSVVGTEGSYEVTFSLTLRYVGQEHSVRVYVEPPDDSVGEDYRTSIGSQFVDQYRILYGHGLSNTDVEITGYEVVLEEKTSRAVELGRRASSEPLPVHETVRKGLLGSDSLELVDVSYLDRTQLVPDQVVEGPALILEEGATTVLPEGSSCQVIEGGHLLVAVGGA